jgi:hypothetical protein
MGLRGEIKKKNIFTCTLANFFDGIVSSKLTSQWKILLYAFNIRFSVFLYNDLAIPYIKIGDMRAAKRMERVICKY